MTLMLQAPNSTSFFFLSVHHQKEKVSDLYYYMQNTISTGIWSYFSTSISNNSYFIFFLLNFKIKINTKYKLENM